MNLDLTTKAWTPPKTQGEPDFLWIPSKIVLYFVTGESQAYGFRLQKEPHFVVGQSQAGVKSVYLLETIGSVSRYAGFGETSEITVV